MNQQEKKELKNYIISEIKELKKDIESLEEKTKPIAPDVSLGRLTRMEAINEKSINEAALRSAKESVIKLKNALEKMDAPGFGTCKKCNKPIPFARLKRVPETIFCVNCLS